MKAYVKCKLIVSSYKKPKHPEKGGGEKNLEVQ